MKARIAVAGLSVLASTFPAGAWELKVDEDPLEDSKVAIITEISSEFVIGFKCWENEPNETLFMLVTMSPFDQSASYKDRVDIVVRVDKGEKNIISMKPREFNGKLGLVAAHSEEPEVMKFLRATGKATQRIALGVFDQVVTVPVRGATKSVNGMLKACAF